MLASYASDELSLVVCIFSDMAGMLPSEEMSSEEWRKSAVRRMSMSVLVRVRTGRKTRPRWAGVSAPMALVGGDACGLRSRVSEDEEVSLGFVAVAAAAGVSAPASAVLLLFLNVVIVSGLQYSDELVMVVIAGIVVLSVAEDVVWAGSRCVLVCVLVWVAL